MRGRRGCRPRPRAAGCRSVPRPSMRTPSLTMRLRTTFFCSERNARLDLPGLRPANCAGLVGRADEREQQAARGSRRAGRCARSCRRSPSPRPCSAAACVGDRVEHVGVVVDVGARTAIVVDRAVRLAMTVGASSFWRSIDAADPLLRLFEALGDDLFGHLRRALLVELPGGLGATGLDHHDRDVAVVEHATGDDELERRLVALLERRVRDPLAVVVREAHRADRAVERDARDRERGRRAVDRQRRRAGSRGRRRGWWR